MGSKNRLSWPGNLVNNGALTEVFARHSLQPTAQVDSEQPATFEEKRIYMYRGSSKYRWKSVQRKMTRHLSVNNASRVKAPMMKKGNSQDNCFSETNRGKVAPPRVTLNVAPGPISAARKQAWRKFWAKLITEVKQAAAEDNNSSDGSG